MKKIGIKGTGAYLPERIIPNSFFEKTLDTSNEWIISRTGIEQRRMVLPGQSLSEIATPACKQALQMAGLSASDLDLIIVGTSTPDMLTPSTGCLLQHRLGAKKAVAFDVSAACPGFIYGLSIAQKFMQDGSHQHALIVGGEILSHRIDYEDRATCVLFGDGVGAVVLGPSKGRGEGEILSVDIQSNGNLWKLLNIPGGGSLHPPSREMVEAGLHHIKMQGNEVFKHAVRYMSDAVRKILENSGFISRQIDWFIPHQANIRIMEAVAKQVEIPLEKVIKTVHKYGNTSAATIPTALDESVRSGPIKKGDLVLVASFGAGFTWGAALFRM
ncbi:MAG: ketoacyl-ACP synthase III [Deltaproteobacteria bacterium]|nr:ketoacyl-ACP synthase III [Deltaproteobacteria bacterium]